MTTNCIIEPRKSYAQRIFTTNDVGWEGVRHVPGGPGATKDFSALIKAAQARFYLLFLCVFCGACARPAEPHATPGGLQAA